MRQHSALSHEYRTQIKRYGTASAYMGLVEAWIYLCGNRRAETILRNGPRILRAMNTVRAEMEAEAQ